ncbi:hypothetical protein HDU98_010731 [Podochytrium sp. JEL0797]|nr:hypothetical protein HDU98_010731 [Podochytrium sp. JEL0797]
MNLSSAPPHGGRRVGLMPPTGGPLLTLSAHQNITHSSTSNALSFPVNQTELNAEFPRAGVYYTTSELNAAEALQTGLNTSHSPYGLGEEDGEDNYSDIAGLFDVSGRYKPVQYSDDEDDENDAAVAGGRILPATKLKKSTKAETLTKKQEEKRAREEEKRSKQMLKDEKTAEREAKKRKKESDEQTKKDARAAEKKAKEDQKEADKKKKEEEAKVYHWNNDAVAPWNTTSLALLLKWLSEFPNYDKLSGGASNMHGESQEKILEEVVALCAQNGITWRTVKSINSKIRELHAQYKKAVDWRANTGEGILDGSMNFVGDNADKYVEQCLLQRCPFFHELDPIFCDLATSQPHIDTDGNERRPTTSTPLRSSAHIPSSSPNPASSLPSTTPSKPTRISIAAPTGTQTSNSTKWLSQIDKMEASTAISNASRELREVELLEITKRTEIRESRRESRESERHAVHLAKDKMDLKFQRIRYKKELEALGLTADEIEEALADE